MERHSVSKLIGSPPGYVGHQETPTIIKEIEKSHIYSKFLIFFSLNKKQEIIKVNWNQFYLFLIIYIYTYIHIYVYIHIYMYI